MAKKIPWLTDELKFPDPATALRQPNGLLAAGGDLSTERLLLAYRHGIFPWYSDGEPILWWSPDPRTIVLAGQLHVSRSLAKTLRKGMFNVTFDQAFAEVVDACSLPRPGQPTTWITTEMKAAYIQLHKLGHAHSVECWYQDKLVGGVYGVSLGSCFFGESMFSTMTDASKVAIVNLEQWMLKNNFKLLDCQVSSSHVLSLGAIEIPRSQFLNLLDNYCGRPTTSG